MLKTDSEQKQKAEIWHDNRTSRSSAQDYVFELPLLSRNLLHNKKKRKENWISLVVLVSERTNGWHPNRKDPESKT